MGIICLFFGWMKKYCGIGIFVKLLVNSILVVVGLGIISFVCGLCDIILVV